MSFYTLKMVHPVSHAVGNTVKRVVLIVFSVLRCCGPCIVSDRHDAPIMHVTRWTPTLSARAHLYHGHTRSLAQVRHSDERPDHRRVNDRGDRCLCVLGREAARQAQDRLGAVRLTVALCDSAAA